MSKRFDAIRKHLPQDYPQDWARLVGVKRPDRVTVIDADVSAVTAAADKVLRIDEPDRWTLHLAFQASHDPTFGERMSLYNVSADRHSLPVRTIAVLLRPQSQGKGTTGTVQRNFPGEDPYLEFRYQIIRLWELTPETLLSGGIGTRPLLPSARVGRPELPGRVTKMSKRRKRNRGTPTSIHFGLPRMF